MWHLQVLVHQMRIPDSWNVGKGQDELLFWVPKLRSFVAPAVQYHDLCHCKVDVCCLRIWTAI